MEYVYITISYVKCFLQAFDIKKPQLNRQL
jgi:hypothetical protein